MQKIFDILKSLVVLVLLIGAVLTLPFFLAAAAVFIVGFIIYLIIKAVRLEKEKTNAQAKANAGY